MLRTGSASGATLIHTTMRSLLPSPGSWSLEARSLRPPQLRAFSAFNSLTSRRPQLPSHGCVSDVLPHNIEDLATSLSVFPNSFMFWGILGPTAQERKSQNIIPKNLSPKVVLRFSPLTRCSQSCTSCNLQSVQSVVNFMQIKKQLSCLTEV